ncbi:MAG: pentapeptide repeat-containing protein [Terriglobales bacterium]
MGNGQSSHYEPGRPLSIRAIVIGGVALAIVAVTAITMLLSFYGEGSRQDQARLEVVRTAGTLVVGTGGAFALLLAARRQRSTEQTLEHEREVAAVAAQDAAKQRITELSSRSIDQLGINQAPVRLGGLYALERLAQDNVDQRQTTVNIFCAYLRMPFNPPIDLPEEASPEQLVYGNDQKYQELQVRLTAQRILAAHLRPGKKDLFWSEIDLDLTRAYLHDFDMSDTVIGKAEFSKAKFAGDTDFSQAAFMGGASFRNASFADVSFWETGFMNFGDFKEVCFHGEAFFMEAKFYGIAVFRGAQFSSIGEFAAAKFSGDAEFFGARFLAAARFDGVEFSEYVEFNETEFSEPSQTSSGDNARSD